MCVCICAHRRADSVPSLEWATKYNPMYESDVTTGYSHYYRRYPEPLIHSSASAEASADFSSEEIQHIYENSELTKEVQKADVCWCAFYFFCHLIYDVSFCLQEIQERIRIIELYAKDRQFVNILSQHQA